MKFRHIFLAAAVFLAANMYAWADDSASFVDLGFSRDGKFYMFAQYGVKSGTLIPWADMYIVDVAKNEFVPGGRLSYTHDNPIYAGQDGAGAMHRLIAVNASLAARYGVTYPNQGQPLYISLDGDPAYDGETITFRDFVSGVFYRAALVESSSVSDGDLHSSFYIMLDCVDIDGTEKTYAVGTPDHRRPFVSSYRIKKVLIAPPGDSLIFVIEMQRQTETGHDIRYMVEALRF
ncbi:MAG: DUF2259 domain-containing protein [Treponema sp.]|nr:DUF2259 domain-containing protein [Treponema sp.]